MAVKTVESKHVQKARKKLEKQLAQEEKKFSSASLDKTRKSIQKLMARQEGDRTPLQLTEKSVTHFDENRHSAAPHSRYVNKLFETLKKETKKRPDHQGLSGRISH